MTKYLQSSHFFSNCRLDCSNICCCAVERKTKFPHKLMKGWELCYKEIVRNVSCKSLCDLYKKLKFSKCAIPSKNLIVAKMLLSVIILKLLRKREK